MAVYKCLHGLAPIYLADDCLTISAIAGKRHLRSARAGLLSVPRTTTTLGRGLSRSQAQSSGTVCQPLGETQLSSPKFARHLKAYLFGLLTARLRTIY